MEQVIVVFANRNSTTEKKEELLELISACDMEVIASFQQNPKHITLATYIGKGKCLEIQEYLHQNPAAYVIFDCDLSPLQIRNLEDILQTKIMDRTELILAIFAKRARTPAARLQIECATLQKLLPRLIGANQQLGRQSASGQNKGSGEKQLEIDRRNIKNRIHEVKRELKKIEKQRETQRRARQKSNLPLVSLIGYTNAGKSTILNRFLDYANQKEEKKVLEKDMLFATLDTSIRVIERGHGHSFLLSDTVGFVSDLPHELIESFHSTLEEVTYSDLLLQVVDGSSGEIQKQMDVTIKTLQNIGAGDIPMLTVFNKCDKTSFTYPRYDADTIYICANEETSIEALCDFIQSHIYPDESRVHMYIPYDAVPIFHILMENANIHEHRYEEDGICIDVTLSKALRKTYDRYIIK